LGRNFCNKLWNACRFRQLQGGATEAEIDPRQLTADDKWILLKLDRAIREIDSAFGEYRFNEVTQTLYRFFWSEYCDWYTEASKAVFQGADPGRKGSVLAVIDFVLAHMLRLFHPFLPFITEELWHGLGYSRDLPERQGGQTIMFARWPKPLDEEFRSHYGLDDCYLEFVDARYELVTLGRNLRSERKIPANKRVRFVLKPAQEMAPHDVQVLRLLLGAEDLELTPDYVAPHGTPMAANRLGELFLPLAGLVDVAAERARLTKDLEKSRGEMEKLQAKLANPNFVQRAPPPVLEEHQRRLAEWQGREQQALAALSNLPA
jgi:valyl-tRNA synthetase